MKSIKTVDENGIIRYKNLNDELHREDGPAWISKIVKHYYRNGLRHREDGPASIYFGGVKQYFLNGNRYIHKSAWEKEILRMKLERLKRL